MQVVHCFWQNSCFRKYVGLAIAGLVYVIGTLDFNENEALRTKWRTYFPKGDIVKTITVPIE
jgi:hypothetical protein